MYLTPKLSRRSSRIPESHRVWGCGRSPPSLAWSVRKSIVGPRGPHVRGVETTPRSSSPTGGRSTEDCVDVGGRRRPGRVWRTPRTPGTPAPKTRGPESAGEESLAEGGWGDTSRREPLYPAGTLASGAVSYLSSTMFVGRQTTTTEVVPALPVLPPRPSLLSPQRTSATWATGALLPQRTQGRKRTRVRGGRCDPTFLSKTPVSETTLSLTPREGSRPPPLPGPSPTSLTSLRPEERDRRGRGPALRSGPEEDAPAGQESPRRPSRTREPPGRRKPRPEIPVSTKTPPP